ncbi:hypothetical protein ACNPQM_35710 [Streptomyces sp. NPDC056231]|uniref:hypothetical protein n=1 Tax=Streptomyces sp. NPDC056231 TaxID=3345755 RepID=UPI003AAF8FA0
MQRDGRVQILGLARSDHDVIVFLEAAGLDDSERILDSLGWVEWPGGRAHRYEAAQERPIPAMPCAAGTRQPPRSTWPVGHRSGAALTRDGMNRSTQVQHVPARLIGP